MKTRHSRNLIDIPHPLYDGSRPTSPKEMLIRAANGLPVEAPLPRADRLPINRKKFFMDSFDVIDIANKDFEAISAKVKAAKAKRQEEHNKQLEAFKKWQDEQIKLQQIKSETQT